MKKELEKALQQIRGIKHMLENQIAELEIIETDLDLLASGLPDEEDTF